MPRVWYTQQQACKECRHVCSTVDASFSKGEFQC
jgi:hypothetical protein